MEAQTNRLINKAWGWYLVNALKSHSKHSQLITPLSTDRYQNLAESQRLIIGVAGIPGSGVCTHPDPRGT